jgi:hypothetical protein
MARSFSTKLAGFEKTCPCSFRHGTKSSLQKKLNPLLEISFIVAVSVDVYTVVNLLPPTVCGLRSGGFSEKYLSARQMLIWKPALHFT